jgi:hypothetical protein
VAAFEFVNCEWGGDWYFAEAAEFCGNLLEHVARDEAYFDILFVEEWVDVLDFCVCCPEGGVGCDFDCGVEDDSALFVFVVEYVDTVLDLRGSGW